MAYTPFNWQDNQAGGTPITAARLNALEAGLQDAAADADAGVTSTSIDDIVIVTQNQYDAIATPVATRLYLIREA